MLEYQVGDYVQGEDYLKRMLDRMRDTAPGPSPEYITPVCLLPMIVRITGELEQLDIAEAAAIAVLSSPSTTPLYAMWARFGLALTAALRGDQEMASKQYYELEPKVRNSMLPGFIAGDRLLGLLAQTMGNLDQAVPHFEDGLVFCRNAGYRPELAWTCCDYADNLLQRDETGDREMAMSLLDESLAISTELGMRPLMERVISRQDGL